MKPSNYYGRAPRDMQSAFGPHASNWITHDPEPSKAHAILRLVVIVASTVAAFGFVVFLAVGPLG